MGVYPIRQTTLFIHFIKKPQLSSITVFSIFLLLFSNPTSALFSITFQEKRSTKMVRNKIFLIHKRFKLNICSGPWFSTFSTALLKRNADAVPEPAEETQGRKKDPEKDPS
jgi:hypothetical protein